jgi:imidazolonepropionase-like amidohydrolase
MCVPLSTKKGCTLTFCFRFQAATAHSFHLPEDLALQSVTSVPARSLEIDHRVGYAKPGYDADIVVWNSHPLSIGATPLQVYIDGKPTLDPKEVADTMPSAMFESTPDIYQPQMRFSPSPETKQDMCEKINSKGKDIVITGIKRSFMKSPSNNAAQVGDFTMIMNSGNVVCFGPSEECVSKTAGSSTIQLKNGHVLPGLIAVSTSLGLSEIDSEQETSDGTVSRKLDVLDPENVNYAKFGVHLDGKAFKRARYGGVTKAITSPITGGGILVGVSVGIKTSGKQNILNGGVFQDDVALHFVIGQADKSKTIFSIFNRATN